MTPRPVNENEKKVLAAIYRYCDSYEGNAVYFKTVESFTGFGTQLSRRCCRSLARKGYAKFERGLFSEDGEVAGSGYGITEAGEYLARSLGFEKQPDL